MIVSLLALAIAVLCLYVLYNLKYKHIQLSTRILLALVIGIIYGLFLKFVPQNLIFTTIKNVLFLIGHGYLSLLKMLVIPLILTSIIHAILNLDIVNSLEIRRMSLLTVILLLGMTAIASLIGLSIGKLFAVGSGLQLPNLTIPAEHHYTGLVDTLLHMLPANPVLVMQQENTIAVVLFAIFIGVAARMLDEADHEKMTTFSKLIASLFAIIKKLAILILRLTPYGIFALISLLIFDQGLVLLSGMANFVLAMYVSMFLVIIMHCLILGFLGQNPLNYFKRSYTALLVAFTTRSSFGTLPVTEETLRNKFKTSQVVATFVPSIGATIGMNACAGVFPAMLVVMTLTLLHQPITFSVVAMVMFINAIASLGVSGIPGTAYIAAMVTLTSLNLPLSIIALVQGIDPIVDMGRTATNVNGVLTTALVVDRIGTYE